MMGSFRRPRPRFMSSPVLSDLARFHASSPSLQISNTSVWNSVQSAVIKVFQGGALQTNELYTLNESIRWLLKTEMGSFITDYFQNQLLTRGLSEVLDQVLLHSGDDQLVVLADMWDRFFTEILPTLQAIFYPVQGQELTVRQMALVAFRDLVLLKLHLEESLETAASVPPPVTQMLLVLQGIHESGGPSLEYYQLERLVEIVVSPYLSNVLQNRNELRLESRHLRSSGSLLSDQSQPEITITQHHNSSDSSSLAPLVEQEGEAYLEKSGGVRRHTVANAHSDVRLLSASGRMHAGTEKSNGVGGGVGGVGFLVGGGPMSPRPFSSQQDMVESTRGGVIC
ncbi:proline-rich protein 5-like [Siniperca chuatsi]|uniref:proline-rich protein 5-like n=1 Tax=Siniperca chuatsi TaxID=119488 RepID=UPI001CE20D08|nr:proline-rich protein 5-like [Siniperca chuatsi]XP_044048184.1 proline-rich protein 5-like [Siniperca chuatsi]XP_044048185.1 proline-rich protein 5-like [Siniperca chuatsi]XP_044048188.1 proline-rich protein 5-like [Siniperca chuatsi]